MEKKVYSAGVIGVSIEIPDGDEEYYQLLWKLGDLREQLRKAKSSIANLYIEKDAPYKYELMPKVKLMRKLRKEIERTKKRINELKQ